MSRRFHASLAYRVAHLCPPPLPPSPLLILTLDSFFDVDRPDLEDRFNFFVHGQKRLFAPVSLFVFNETHPFRLAVVWLVEWKWFDYFILFLICANSVTLAMTDWECVDKDGALVVENCYKYRPPRFYELEGADAFDCGSPGQQTLFTCVPCPFGHRFPPFALIPSNYYPHLRNSDSTRNQIVLELEPVFTGLFTIECILKVLI